jgi:hypothetical protein
VALPRRITSFRWDNLVTISALTATLFKLHLVTFMPQPEEKLGRWFSLRIGETLKVKFVCLPRKRRRQILDQMREFLEQLVSESV